jgi:hypothetical protein
VAKPYFPPWVFFAEIAAILVALIFVGLLLRRLRLVHPAIWENLGRPTLFMGMWPGSIIALAERFDANFRLLAFPFRAQSFQLDDPSTKIILWLVRASLGLTAIFGLWSWLANP